MPFLNWKAVTATGKRLLDSTVPCAYCRMVGRLSLLEENCMIFTLKNPKNLRELFTEQGVTGLDFVSMSIGYNGKVYFLFSSQIPPRIDGMFVDTVANAEYTAVAMTPSWESGIIENVERIDFGQHRTNFCFVRPVPDGSFLLLGSRCMYSKKNGPEKNAVFVDKAGNVLRSLTFGDGIADCIVRNDGIIITSYFDEGIIGNYGWEDPIGSCGVCAWTADGKIIWRCDRDILDCYAMNIDEAGKLWYYYYTDFLLVRTDFRNESEFDPNVEGADCFAVVGNGKYLIMNGGYDDDDSFFVSRIFGDRITDTEPLEFVNDKGAAIPATPAVFNGSKSLVLTKDGAICFADFSRMI